MEEDTQDPQMEMKAEERNSLILQTVHGEEIRQMELVAEVEEETVDHQMTEAEEETVDHQTVEVEDETAYHQTPPGGPNDGNNQLDARKS